MRIQDLLSRGRVVCGLSVKSKKKALERLSETVCRDATELTQNEIFTSLINREKLGSTGLGHGVAIPHGRVANTEQAIGTVIKLEEAIDFDSPDGVPVDVLFGLIVPEDSTSEHLLILRQLAEMFSDEDFCSTLREASDSNQLFDLIDDWNPDTGST